jgi:hypothetical protein
MVSDAPPTVSFEENRVSFTAKTFSDTFSTHSFELPMVSCAQKSKNLADERFLPRSE